MDRKIEICDSDHLETLRRCGGYYCCPRDPDTGKRLGPLVGYAGKYTGVDGRQLQYVGNIYANFAKAEEYSDVLYRFSGMLSLKIIAGLRIGTDFLIGMPIGGYSLATALGLATGIGVIKAEKKVTALATAGGREQSELAFIRHEIERGAGYVLVDDVCNNFSTTATAIELVMGLGGDVLGIVCFLNRSPTVDDEFVLPMTDGTPHGFPVISLVRKVIPEYRQDDHIVADDVVAGNVVWKPKNEWFRLEKAMAEHP